MSDDAAFLRAIKVTPDDPNCEGYRTGNFHEVYRHSRSLLDGSGAEVYELGRRLATLAGVRRFSETQEE